MERRSRYSRLIGVIYIIGAVFGFIISLGGLMILWTTKAEVTAAVTEAVVLVGRTLAATHETIQVINQSLDQAGEDLDLIQGILGEVAGTLSESDGLLTDTSNMVGSELVSFVEDAQDSLDSVQVGARLVDDALRLVSRVPLLGVRYTPEVPLQESIAEVSRSLEPLPGSFGKIQSGLDTSAAHLATVQLDVERLADEIDQIDTSLSTAHEVSKEYNAILAEVQQRYDQVEERIPLALNLFYLGLTSILVWILITQTGMLIHGIELLQK